MDKFTVAYLRGGEDISAYLEGGALDSVVNTRTCIIADSGQNNGLTNVRVRFGGLMYHRFRRGLLDRNGTKQLRLGRSSMSEDGKKKARVTI